MVKQQFDMKELWQIKVALEYRIEDIESTSKAVSTDINETSVMIYQDNINSARSALEKIKIILRGTKEGELQ